MRALANRLAAVAAVGGVVAQLAFPFAGGGTIALTTASVLLFATAAALHAGSVGGWRLGAGLVTAVAVVALLAESVGVATGFPFGEYAYTGALGPSVLGVSVLVLLAWLTLAYPSYVVARRLVGTGGRWRRPARVAVAAVALTAWDVFLDPQMVEAGNWTWAHPEPSLPGTGGIPLTNYAGWLLVSAIIALALEGLYEVARRRAAHTANDHSRGAHTLAAHTLAAHTLGARSPHAQSAGARRLAEPDTQRADAVPYGVYLWTYVSCVVANLSFWDRPAVALAGGIAMGVVAVPLVLTLRAGAREHGDGRRDDDQHSDSRPSGVGSGDVGSRGVGPRAVGPRAVGSGGVEPSGVGPRGVRPRGVGPRAVGSGGVEPGGVGPSGVRPRGVEPGGTDARAGGPS